MCFCHHSGRRWINCLLIREVPFGLATRLWDTYLAEGSRLKGFLIYVAAAFLLSWSGPLRTMDFQVGQLPSSFLSPFKWTATVMQWATCRIHPPLCWAQTTWSVSCTACTSSAERFRRRQTHLPATSSLEGCEVQLQMVHWCRKSCCSCKSRPRRSGARRTSSPCWRGRTCGGPASGTRAATSLSGDGGRGSSSAACRGGAPQELMAASAQRAALAHAMERAAAAHQLSDGQCQPPSYAFGASNPGRSRLGLRYRRLAAERPYQAQSGFHTQPPAYGQRPAVALRPMYFAACCVTGNEAGRHWCRRYSPRRC